MKVFSWTEIVLLGGAWVALVVLGPMTGPEAWSWTRFAIALALASTVALPIVILRLAARRSWRQSRPLFGWLAAPPLGDLPARMMATVAAAGGPVPGVLSGPRLDRTAALLGQMLPRGKGPGRAALPGLACRPDGGAYSALLADARAAQAAARAAGPAATGALLSALLLAAEHNGEVSDDARQVCIDLLGALTGDRAAAAAEVADALSAAEDQR